jgi:hypothetical protein
MTVEAIRQVECLNCNANLIEIQKNRKAMYCGVKCKNAHRKTRNPLVHTEQTSKYKSKMRGRAIVMYHGTKVGRRFRDNNELTPEWIMEKLKTGVCEVTGLPFTYTLNARNPWSPSLDRIDPNIGYTLGNTRVVVWIYNAAKNVFTDADVHLMAQALINPDGSMK